MTLIRLCKEKFLWNAKVPCTDRRLKLIRCFCPSLRAVRTIIAASLQNAIDTIDEEKFAKTFRRENIIDKKFYGETIK